MIVFQFVIFIFALLVFVFSAYLCVLSFGAWIFKKVASENTMPLSMAVIILAHNQESTIKKTLESIYMSEYQLSIVDVLVIADNCTDATVEIAKNCGAQVLERSNTEHGGKNKALEWFLREHKLSYENSEALVVIDAGTIIDRHFLSQISASLSKPEVDVVQGFYGLANPVENWRIGLCTAALNVFNHVRPAGRNAFGGSAGLRGNGVAFKPNVFKSYHWPPNFVLEDLEFSTELILKDMIVHYNPDAIALGWMFEDEEKARLQRVGHKDGRFRTISKYGPELLKRFYKERKFLYFDGFMELFMPSLTMLFAAQVLLLFLACLFFQGIVFDSILCLFFTAIYVLSGMILCKAPLSVWLAFLGTPLYILKRLIFYVKKRHVQGQRG